MNLKNNNIKFNKCELAISAFSAINSFDIPSQINEFVCDDILNKILEDQNFHGSNILEHDLSMLLDVGYEITSGVGFGLLISWGYADYTIAISNKIKAQMSLSGYRPDFNPKFPVIHGSAIGYLASNYPFIMLLAEHNLDHLYQDNLQYINI